MSHTWVKVVGATGFEPATSWSQTKRSTKLSYAPDAMLGVLWPQTGPRQGNLLVLENQRLRGERPLTLSHCTDGGKCAAEQTVQSA